MAYGENNFSEEEIAEAEGIVEDALEGIIYLTDEDENDVPFRYLDEIEYESKLYAVLLPLEEDDDAAEVVILEVVSDEDEEYDSFEGVDDEETLEAVFNIFKEKFSDEFNFS